MLEDHAKNTRRSSLRSSIVSFEDAENKIALALSVSINLFHSQPRTKTMQMQQSRNAFLAVAALLVTMALLAGGAARRESVTVDEVAHIGAGVSYLQKLDLRMNEEHPPLAKVLAALPLVLRGVPADYSNVSWTFSNNMFSAYLGEWVFGHWLIMRWNDR